MGLSGSTRNWLAFSVALLLSTNINAAPYQIIELGTLGGEKNFAFSLNDINEVVGSSDGRALEEDEITDENPGVICVSGSSLVIREYCNHGYLYRNASIIDLGQFDQDGSYALSINNNSIAVGYGTISLSDDDPDTADPVVEQAFVSIDGATIQTIRFPDEAMNITEGLNPVSRALHISDTNLITGLAFIAVPTVTDPDVFVSTTRPFIYDLDNDTYQIIPPFAEDDLDFTGTGRSMNSSGQLVGWGTIDLEDAGTTTQALLWDPASPDLSQTLGTLGGFSSQAYDINDNGLIVGQSDTDENFFRNEDMAFVYDITSATMTRLPEFSTISEFTTSIAYAINNSNQIVGAAQSAVSASTNSAFIYTVGDEELVNLNDMIPCDSGWVLTLARDINESGHIVGTGTFAGEVRSFLLVPTANTAPTNCTQPVEEGGSSSSSEYFILSILGLAYIRRRIFKIQDV